ncbi:MAG: hypothetical protein WAW62_00920 [Candidatus Saccharimonas aalborgensis]
MIWSADTNNPERANRHEQYLRAERPDLVQAIGDIYTAVDPVVRSLGQCAAFDGVVLFMRDRWYSDSAAAITAINAPAIDDARLDFQRTNINGRRVDLVASRVGETFRTGRSEFAPSLMNPEQHIVFGMPLALEREGEAVFQFAFSPEHGKLPSELQLRQLWQQYHQAIQASTAQLDTLGQGYYSLADKLLLDVPTTPNAYILMWDMSHSTEAAAKDYPLLRDFLDQIRAVFDEEVARVGGQSMELGNGDGQKFRIELPYPEIDRNDLSAVGHYGGSIVVPLLQRLIARYDQLAAKTHGIAGPVRIAAELGCFENTTLGQSSPSFWPMDKALEALPRDRSCLVLGQTAERAISQSRLQK